ncbi:kelch-like protein 28 [Paramacrobiotus metropolitanus]|uniref:kelch-like protein 28 n=1 Tax=Paramacrobiotus metropolitanus TaxID=2943436 RepID=UPI002445BD4D|nr:kelch-like protein 28 [Paramacrobiotus metropolitanus]
MTAASASPATAQFKPRHSFGAQEGILCAAGFGEEGQYGVDKSLDVFCPSIPAVWRLGDLPVAVEQCSVAMLDASTMMVCSRRTNLTGHRDSRGTEFSTSVEVYDPDSRSWSAVAALPVTLAYVALVACDGRLYAFGGQRGALGVSACSSFS